MPLVDELKDQVMEAGKHVGDVVSIGLVVGTLANWLPAIAALLSIVWTGIRIFESRTVQGWIARLRSPQG
jgi:hypothetical protein